MTDVTQILKRLRQSWSRGPEIDPEDPGIDTILDGLSAAALVSSIADADVPAPRDVATDARGAYAHAVGLAMSGGRADVVLLGSDLAAVQDLLQIAAGRQLPIVTHVINRAVPGHATALGSDHAALHQACSTGSTVLVATGVQDVVDLGLIARAVAEQVLVPTLVAQDDGETAHAMEDVRVPSGRTVRGLLGEPGDMVDSATPAQVMLFGDMRRRVPRWYDLERPTLTGAIAPPEVWALGAAARGPYVLGHVASALDATIDAYARITGRHLSRLVTRDVEKSDVVIVTMGSSVETATAVADHLRTHSKRRIGVIGIRSLRPFPEAELAGLLRGKHTVLVLERADGLAPTAPLTQALRSMAEAALENGRAGRDAHPEQPGWKPQDAPRFRTALHGLGGATLLASELIALCEGAKSDTRSTVYLGLDFAPPGSPYPKRRILTEEIAKGYPAARDLALVSRAPSPDLRPEGTTTVQVVGTDPDITRRLATALASLHQKVTGGHVRGRFDGIATPADPSTIRLTLGSAGLRVADASTPVDVLLIADPKAGRAPRPSMSPTARVVTASATTHPDSNGQGPRLTPEVAEEALLGVLAAATFEGDESVTARRLVSARESQLEDLSERAREAHLDAFREALESGQGIERAKADAVSTPAYSDPEPPFAVRRLQRTDTAHDSLPRFWDQIGVAYHAGELSELSPDPYLAAGTVPMMASSFWDRTDGRTMMPELDPTLCTGCGDCWIGCPEGAIGPVALGIKPLIEAGMEHARSEGHEVDALRMMLGKLADRAQREIQKADPAPTTVGETLQSAFEWLLEKMAPPEDRRTALETAFTAVLDTIADLPIARTAPFFDRPQAQAPGSGELLALVLNPESCTGCGICVQACRPGALTARPQTPERVETARRHWRRWQWLPDTSGATIARVKDDAEVGRAAALLLSRHCLMTMAGGDTAEPGSGEKIALRLSLAAVESEVQPAILATVEEVEGLQATFAEEIRETLVAALPTTDLDALADGIQSLAGTDLDVASLAGKVEEATQTGHVDAKKLGLLVQTARDLADLRWQLTEGPNGIGRARAGLAVARGSVADWAGRFPHNPFSQPVLIDGTGDAAQLARGLFEGQMRAIIDGHYVVRQARFALENPAEATHGVTAPRPTSWKDLTDDERRSSPPLILVASEATLSEVGAAEILSILSSGLPLTVLLLADPARGFPRALQDLGLNAVIHRSGFVVETTIARPEHLMVGVRDALRHRGPALVRVHAPSPRRDGFAKDVTLDEAALALESRVLPLFRYDPTGDGVFGSRLDLSGNPGDDMGWVIAEDGTPITAVHWALTQDRFAPWLRPLTDDDPAPVALAEFLALPADGRTGKTPFIEKPTPDATPLRLRVAPELVDFARTRLEIWQTLQELSGVVTPFTEQVKQEAAEAVASAHEAEIATVKKEHEGQLASLRGEVQEELAGRLQQRLLALAARQTAGAGAGAGAGKEPS